jgi:hypothetical protein
VDLAPASETCVAGGRSATDRAKARSSRSGSGSGTPASTGTTEANSISPSGLLAASAST